MSFCLEPHKTLESPLKLLKFFVFYKIVFISAVKLEICDD